MAGYVQPMVREVGAAVLQGDEDELDRIRLLDKDVDVFRETGFGVKGEGVTARNDRLNVSRAQALEQFFEVLRCSSPGS